MWLSYVSTAVCSRAVRAGVFRAAPQPKQGWDPSGPAPPRSNAEMMMWNPRGPITPLAMIRAPCPAVSQMMIAIASQFHCCYDS